MMSPDAQRVLRDQFNKYLERNTGKKGYDYLKGIEQQEFIKVANDAHELVGHNSDMFDLPWIRTRCLFHNIDMFPNYTTIDTYKISKNHQKLQDLQELSISQ